MPDGAAVVGAGAGWGLAVALPAALLAQVLDATVDEGVPAAVVAPLVVLVLAGVALAGWMAGRRAGSARRRSLGLGAGAGLLTVLAVQALGVARRLVADGDVAWETIPAVTVLGILVALAAAVVATRPAGRTRP